MTEEGRQALIAEVEQMESAGRAELAEQIKVAREWGDLKENAEYHAAKEALAHLEAKIAKIRTQLLDAEIVEVSKSGDVAEFGSTVEIKDDGGREITYTLVSPHEADVAKGLLSIESPVGVALRGTKVGQTTKVETPKGSRSFKVVSVK
ncbi:MAG: transcription elongation factor GreA [Thermoleophilaceae bacterium]|nr:transcription elongation factor GreA [Thermoleophilaceae bacterium]